MTRPTSRHIVATLAAAALGLTACGGGSDGDSIDLTAAPAAASAGAADGVAPAAGTSPLPVVEVIDLATGSPTQLDALLPADQPLLLWFWAPW